MSLDDVWKWEVMLQEVRKIQQAIVDDHLSLKHTCSLSPIIRQNDTDFLPFLGHERNFAAVNAKLRWHGQTGELVLPLVTWWETVIVSLTSLRDLLFMISEYIYNLTHTLE